MMRRLECVTGKGWGCLLCWQLLGRDVDAAVLLVEEREAERWRKTGLCANHAEVMNMAVIKQA